MEAIGGVEKNFQMRILNQIVMDEYLKSLGFEPLAHGCSALDLIKRPKITVKS